MFEQMIRQIYVENTQILLINFLCYTLLFTGIMTYFHYQKWVQEKRLRKQQNLRDHTEDLEDKGLAIEEIRDDRRYRELSEDMYRTRREFQYDQLAAAFLVAIFGSVMVLAPTASFLEGVLAYLINS